MKIFIIGPGDVGKSESGKFLAEKIKYELVDLDRKFMNLLGDIGLFIKNNGYKKYAYKNSEIFQSLLNKSKDNIVFVLSSGFLVHKGLTSLTTKHAELLKQNGLSILLLPAKNINETIEIVTKRQLNRGLGLNEKREREKIKERFYKYLEFGDIRIFSQNKPEAIAEEMFDNLTNKLVL